MNQKLLSLRWLINDKQASLRNTIPLLKHIARARSSETIQSKGRQIQYANVSGTIELYHNPLAINSIERMILPWRLWNKNGAMPRMYFSEPCGSQLHLVSTGLPFFIIVIIGRGSNSNEISQAAFKRWQLFDLEYGRG